MPIDDGKREYDKESQKKDMNLSPRGDSPTTQDVPISNIPIFTSHDAPEIEYHYLTFESDIPLTPVLPPNVKTELPPCPNIGDYDNPMTWPLTRKNLVTYLCSSVNILAAYASGAYASPAYVLTEKWSISEVAYLAGITIFTVGFGVAPMVLAPFSEINGRRPVFISTGLLFVGKLSLYIFKHPRLTSV